MASPSLLSTLLSLALLTYTYSLQLRPTLAAELLNNACITPTPDTFTSPSQYNTNLNSLLKILANPPSTGFTLNATGKPDSQVAYGLINCYSGVSSQDCKACARDATKAARILCPGSQGAVMWYDDCLLKYTPETDYMGFVDTTNKFWMRSNVAVGGDVAKFNARVVELLKKLNKKATANIFPAETKLFAEAKTKADANTTVYARVDCTRDLSGGPCEDCLEEVIGDFPVCCDGVKGGRYITASCMFRFEEYPF